jgi:hypothetical protein
VEAHFHLDHHGGGDAVLVAGFEFPFLDGFDCFSSKPTPGERRTSMSCVRPSGPDNQRQHDRALIFDVLRLVGKFRIEGIEHSRDSDSAADVVDSASDSPSVPWTAPGLWPEPMAPPVPPPIPGPELMPLEGRARTSDGSPTGPSCANLICGGTPTRRFRMDEADSSTLKRSKMKLKALPAWRESGRRSRPRTREGLGFPPWWS